MLLSHTFGMVSTNVMNLFGWHVVGVVKNLSVVAVFMVGIGFKHTLWEECE